MHCAICDALLVGEEIVSATRCCSDACRALLREQLALERLGLLGMAQALFGPSVLGPEGGVPTFVFFDYGVGHGFDVSLN